MNDKEVEYNGKSVKQNNDLFDPSADGIRYLREYNAGYNIGLDKFSNFAPTSIMTILTDRYGNLITTTPGVIK